MVTSDRALPVSLTYLPKHANLLVGLHSHITNDLASPEILICIFVVPTNVTIMNY